MNNIARLFPIVLLLSWGVLFGQSGGQLIFFGPETFARTSAEPNVLHSQFDLLPGVEAPFMLTLRNGNPDGSRRVSSATVILNGVEVVSRNEFNQQVGFIQKEVAIFDRNELEVRLQSAPDSFLVAAVTGFTTEIPAFGFVAADPSAIPIGSATEVTVTAGISDPTVVSDSVVLNQVDSDGNLIAQLGVLRDDGLGADLAPGDGIYTFQFDLTPTGEGETLLRVSAVFASLLSPAFSETFAVSHAVTTLRGRVADTLENALQGVELRIGETVSVSDESGSFELRGIPSGSQLLRIRGSAIGPFADVNERLEVVANQVTELLRPIFLPRLDVENAVPVDPTQDTLVSTPLLPNVSLLVEAGTAQNVDGSLFDGSISITDVPPARTPMALPPDFRPAQVISLQPEGIRLTRPAPLTFPNRDNLPPGSVLNLWSLDPDTGTFINVGTGTVNPDGSRIVSDPGSGARTLSWHFPLPPPLDPDTEDNNDENQDQSMCTDCAGGSSLALRTGNLSVDFTLPSYRSNGISRSHRLVYNSSAANCRPIVTVDTLLGPQVATPLTFSLQPVFDGETGTERFYESSRTPTRLAVQINSENLPTGIYPTELRTFAHYEASSIAATAQQALLVNNQRGSRLGAGWTLEGVDRLNFNTVDGSVLLTQGDGSAKIFRPGAQLPDGSMEFLAPPGDFSRLVRRPDGAWSRTTRQGVRFDFSPQGLQTAATDRNGNATAYAYDSQGRIRTITDPRGLATNLGYDEAGFLRTVAGPGGLVTQFNHDLQGNLTRITTPDGAATRFAYDVAHRLISQTNPRGFVTAYRYDFASTLSEVGRADGSIRRLNAGRANGLIDPASGQGTAESPAPLTFSADVASLISDGRGNALSFRTDRFGATTQLVDSLGRITSIERDDDGNERRVARPGGGVTVSDYDANGNLLSSFEESSQAATLYSYQPDFSQIDTIVDPNGNLTQFQYDANGNRIETIEPTGARTQLEYGDPNCPGQPTSLTAAAGLPQAKTTFFSYDPFTCNRVEITDAMGTRTLEYDARGNVIRSTDGAGRLTQYSYDAMNRLVQVVEPGGGAAGYQYDGNGNLVQATNTRGGITRFEYDAQDRLIQVTDPLGAVETFAYDADSNLVSVTDRKGQTIEYQYNAANLVTKTIFPGGLERVYSYDEAGNLTEAVDSDSRLTMVYDAENRPLLASTAGSPSQPEAVLRFSYDQNGNRRAFDDSVDTLVYGYDELNRLTLISPSGGNFPNGGFETGDFTGFSVDGETQVITNLGPIGPPEGQFMAFLSTGGQAVNSRISFLTTEPFLVPAGATTLNFEFNFLSNEFPNFVGGPFNDTLQATFTTPSGSETLVLASVNSSSFVAAPGTGFNGQTGFSTFVFDVSAHAGSNIPCTLTLAIEVFDQGDALVDSAGLIDALRFDLGGQADQTIRFAYDGLNSRTQTLLPNGAAVTFEHDMAGRPISLINQSAAGMVSRFEYQYDAAGNRRRLSQQRTALATTPVLDYAYDDLDRLVSATHPLPGGPPETFVYDSAGNRLSRDGQAVDAIFDPANRLIEDQEFLYDYDANGNLVQKMEKAGGAVVRYAYDAENQLTRIDLPGGGFAEYRYDSLGRRIWKNVNGSIRSYVYDQEDIVLEFDGQQNLLARYVHGPEMDEPLFMDRDLDGSGDFDPNERFVYHTDGLGSVTELTDASGNIVQAYVYDSFGNQAIAFGNMENPFSYTGREFDSESGFYYYRFRYYDPAIGRFNQEDPVGFRGDDLNLYPYALNNPATLRDATGLWFGADDVFTGPIDEALVLGILFTAAWLGFEPAQQAAEQLTDALTSLMASSGSQKGVGNNAENIAQHLANLVGADVAGFPPNKPNDPRCFRGWKKEIQTFINNIKKAKLSPKQLLRELRKRLSDDQIRDLLQRLKDAGFDDLFPPGQCPI